MNYSRLNLLSFGPKMCNFYFSSPKAITYHFIFYLIVSIFVQTTADEKGKNKLCRDGKENYVEAHSDQKSQYPVIIRSLRGTLYWPDKKPACYNGRATVLMPGVVHLYEGEMNVPKNNYDLLKSGTMRMTIKSPNFDEPICLNGTSQYTFLPNSWCKFNLCEFIGNNLCEFLQRPGIHTIHEMEQKINFNSTLLLPEPPSIFGISLLDVLSGEFSFVMALETDGKTILELNIPTNQKFLQIGLEPPESEC